MEYEFRSGAWYISNVDAPGPAAGNTRGERGRNDFSKSYSAP
jgi:hypothetical protein